MANSDEDFKFPIGRWLLWALGALAALVLIVVGLNWFSSEETPEATQDTLVNPQIEWSIVLIDQNGATVTLKGDLPRGRPTETWQDDSLLLRSAEGTFDWDMDLELPVAVVEIDEAAGCDGLNNQLDVWVAEIASVETGQAEHWQARGFAQHALDVMKSSDCEIDEATLQVVADEG